jgi:phosphoribosylaminoimidazole carboxylase PurE protein
MTEPRVAIMIGSANDLEVIAEAAKELDRFSVPYVVEVTSAHRSPRHTIEFVAECERRGVQVFICSAGMAAHLGGVVAAHTTRPVLGVPLKGGVMDGLDSLLSTVMMPRGIPVGTLAIGGSGAANAAMLACQILALADPRLAQKLVQRREDMAREVADSNVAAQARLGQLVGKPS